MIAKETEEAILTLQKKGVPIKQICRLLKTSRNAVRRVLRGLPVKPSPSSREAGQEPLIEEIFKQCAGNVVRVREVLAGEHRLDIAYSTLTRKVRELELRGAKQRAGRYSFEPGEEMQHDTSPHRVVIGAKRTTAQCAALVLAYSRRAVVRYYPAFTRFEAKVFFAEALSVLEGSCSRCVIDNTSVMVAAGSGPGAVIAPEMETFAGIFGFIFVPHRINHPDRKGRVERFFSYVEKNFLSGRTFSDWQDLNRQVDEWCRQTADGRHMKPLGMSPSAAFIMEKPHLKPLPPHVPPVYKTEHRRVDVEGYVNLDTNRYSVPERHLGQTVEVQKHWEQVKIYQGRRLIAEHQRAIGERDRRITAPGHCRPAPSRKVAGPSAEQQALNGESPILDEYLRLMAKRFPGRGGARLQRLLHLKRTYPADAFLAAVSQAGKYGLFDLARLERIILKNVADDFFSLD